MTKKTDDKAKKDDEKDLDKEELENEDEEDEEDEDEDEEDEDEEDEEEEEAKAAPAKPVDRRRPRHEEYLAGGDTKPADAEDPAWWAPHAVLGVLVLLGVLGFLGVFNKAVSAIAPKLGGGADTTTATAPTSKAASQTPTPPAPQQAQPPREMFGAKHILVMYKGSRRAPPGIERTKEEAQARAAEAQKKAKGGTKFEDLVKEYSDEPNAGQRGGDLGKFPKGSMVPEFQAGLEKTKVGEISDVVESPFGFHVILRTQ
jgi:hypothetical protein